MPGGKDFARYWGYEDDVEVCIKHFKKDWLRIDNDDKKDIDWDGNLGGGKAIWKTKVKNNNLVAFQSTKTDKFLCLEEDGKGWAANVGKKNDRIWFKVDKYGQGHYVFRSKEDDQQCLGTKNGSPIPIQVMMKGKKQIFSTPYDDDGDRKDKVVITHQLGKSLKYKNEELSSEGGHGKKCQWVLIHEDGKKCRIKPKGGDGFLRIKKDGEVDVGGSKTGDLTELKMVREFDDVHHVVHFKSTATKKFIGVGNGGKIKSFDEKREQTRFCLFTNENDDEDGSED